MPPPRYAARCGPTPAIRLTHGLRCPARLASSSCDFHEYSRCTRQTSWDVRQYHCLMPLHRGRGHRISITSYGWNFRGACGKSDQCSVISKCLIDRPTTDNTSWNVAVQHPRSRRATNSLQTIVRWGTTDRVSSSCRTTFIWPQWHGPPPHQQPNISADRTYYLLNPATIGQERYVWSYYSSHS